MKKIVSFIVSAFILQQAPAQEKRALLIGINQYNAPKGYKSPIQTLRSGFKDLNGAVNDVRAVYSVIVSKFYFKKENTDTLMNRAATRDAILKGMNDLLEKSKAGDFAFIFYAGHGSQVVNTASQEPDKKDESIVPADTYKLGVPDIRDKELAAIYNKFLGKGIKLTVFMDCCHSGSGSRGPVDKMQDRFLPDAGYDVKDASNPTPPETRTDASFLIISSAQDVQRAKEKLNDEKQMHGAFTTAFLQALNQQSVNTSVQTIFNSARAILKSDALMLQEPVLAGSPERLQQTFLGFEKGTIEDRVIVPVISREGRQAIVQGGFALGIFAENELAKINGTDTVAVIKIDTVLGVNRAYATVIKGSEKDLKPGDMLQVINWVSSQAPLLKVYVPATGVSYEQTIKMARVANEIKNSRKVKWVSSLEKADPYTTIYTDGNVYKVNINGKEVAAPKTITSSSLLQFGKPDSTFYFEVPATTAINEDLKKKFLVNKSLLIVNNPAEAHYTLFGTIDEKGNPAYGLRLIQTNAADSLGSMPVQTKTFPLLSTDAKAIASVTDSLYELSMKLSKIRGWMHLAPPAGSSEKFPFHLEVFQNGTKLNNPEVMLGSKMEIHLAVNEGAEPAMEFKKYVYVFLIDKDGNMILGYPNIRDGNQLNQFPKQDNSKQIVKDIKLFGGTVSTPLGTDNYFLLATDESIPNFGAVFKQVGVRGNDRNNPNPLSNLMNMGNAGGTRSLTKTISNWTLIKLQVKSTR